MRFFPSVPSLLVVSTLLALGAGCQSEEPENFRAAQPLDAVENHFVTVWGYEGVGLFNNKPSNTHTWATFVTVFGKDLDVAPLDSFTISWLPENGDVGFLNGILPGRNFTLEETLDLAEEKPVVVDRSALFRITPDLFDAAVAHKSRLDDGSADGSVSYRMVDSKLGRKQILKGHPGGFTNCIHAVSDLTLTPGGNLLTTGGANGFPASKQVLSHLKVMGGIGSATFDDSLADRLGI